MVDLLTTYRVPCGLYVRKRTPIIIALFSYTLVFSLRSWCLYSAGWMFSCGSLASLRWGRFVQVQPPFHPCSSPNRKIHDFLAGWSTFSYKGALSNSKFVQFSN